MTTNILALPIDIPWKRIAISPDMYAVNRNGPLPLKWRSSLAVFSYDPVPDPELTNPDEITTFLKVVATVSGYQPEGYEIDTGLITPYWSSHVVHNYEGLTSDSYPCLASIVQVAVFPSDDRWGVDQFPYLTDFEPKKRELVELVTDTGEALTQSSNDINVRKGTTSTDSTEMDNIDRGGSFGLSVNTPYGGGGVNASHQQEVGTRSTLGTTGVNLVTTDSSREKRESYSHTTNLSQLYHLLDSYHAGTNRAIFFLNARPHMVDSDYTFVKGPRRLEGVQEFFLVVRRPKEMTDLCVVATLETGHLHTTTSTQTTGSTTYDQQQLDQTFTLQARGGGDFHGSDDSPGAWTMQVPGGYHLDRSRGGGTFTYNWGSGPVTVTLPAGVSIDNWSAQTADGHQGEAQPTITTYDDHVDITAHVYGWFGGGDTDGKLSLTVTVYTISDQPTSTPSTSTVTSTDFFITAREARSCAGWEEEARLPLEASYVSYEQAAPQQVSELLTTAGGAGRPALAAANQVSRYVAGQMISSFRQSRRYPPRAVSFLATRFALRRLLAGLDDLPVDQNPQPLAEVKGLDPNTRALVRKRAPRLTVGETLQLAPEDLARRLKLDPLEARTIFHQILGVTPTQDFQTGGVSEARTAGVSGGTAPAVASPPSRPERRPSTAGRSVSRRRARREEEYEPER